MQSSAEHCLVLMISLVSTSEPLNEWWTQILTGIADMVLEDVTE